MMKLKASVIGFKINRVKTFLKLHFIYQKFSFSFACCLFLIFLADSLQFLLLTEISHTFFLKLPMWKKDFSNGSFDFCSHEYFLLSLDVFNQCQHIFFRTVFLRRMIFLSKNSTLIVLITRFSLFLFSFFISFCSVSSNTSSNVRGFLNVIFRLATSSNKV